MKVFLSAILLLLAFVLQGQFSDRIAPAPAWRPDFIFAVVISCSLFLHGKSLPVIAFLGGVLEGVLLGANLSAFIVSRLLTSLITNFIVEPLEINIIVAFAVGTISAFIGQVVYLLVQPMTDILWWLLIALKQSLVTGILVMLLFPLFRKVYSRFEVSEAGVL